MRGKIAGGGRTLVRCRGIMDYCGAGWRGKSIITLWLVAVCAPAIFGQPYTISTAVGAGPPSNIPGTSASFASGLPSFLTVDPAGNVFFVDQNAVVERSAAS